MKNIPIYIALLNIYFLVLANLINSIGVKYKKYLVVTNASRFGPFPARPLSCSTPYPLCPLEHNKLQAYRPMWRE